MTDGVIKTQDSKLFFATAASEILQVACPTGITGLGGAADQIDSTCLDSTERQYVRGMLNPGQITVPINLIPRSAAHQALITLRESGDVVSWMIVLSDQTAEPTTFDSEDRIESPGPTTVEWQGYIADLTVDIAINEIVRGTMVIQRSGAAVWHFPTADLA